MWTSRRWQGKEGKKKKDLYKRVSSVSSVSPSHKMNNNCNKKDNILIYNNLEKTAYTTGDSETVRHLRHFCKDFSNGYTFSDKLDTSEPLSLFLKII